MTIPTVYSFPRYLAAKRTVDDRALNHRVAETLQRTLHARPESAGPLRVLEIGGGIGTMVERMLENGTLGPAQYLLLDAEADNIAAAHDRLMAWAARRAVAAAVPPDKLRPDGPTGPQITLPAPAGEVTVRLLHQDLFAYLADAAQETQFDLVIAHAFIDLVDVPSTLQILHSVLKPHALLYLTINFDGGTILQPEIDPALDAAIERLYHATMDNRVTDGRPSGDSQTGRHLFGHLKAAGIEILDAGSSDWVVLPAGGAYPADEAYFLHFIVNTIHGALRGSPDLPVASFERWIAARHDQIERGELMFIAHQLDYLGRYIG